MMEQNTAVDQEQFRRVWDRVRSGESAPAYLHVMPEPPAPVREEVRDPAAVLAAAVDDACSRAALCGSVPQLFCIRRRCMEQGKRLSAALFLLSGKQRSCPPGRNREPVNLLERCRRLYLAFRQAGKRLSLAAGEADDPQLQALFRELAQDCGACAQQVRSVVEQII